MNNFDFGRQHNANEQNLDGIGSSLKNAVKKITKAALDPREHLKQIKGSLTNPKAQLKKDAQLFVDVHAKPVHALTQKLGPQRTAILSTVVAFIPVGGPIAAAALMASSAYNDYKSTVAAEKLNEKLQLAYTNFNKNFDALPVNHKREVAKLIESAETSPAAMDGVVLALQEYATGNWAPLEKFMAATRPKVAAPKPGKTSVSAAPAPAEKTTLQKLTPWLLSAAGYLIFKG